MGRKNRKKKKISDSPQVSIAKTKDIWGISIGLFGVLIAGLSLLLSYTQVTENKQQGTKINELNRKVEAREIRENTPDVRVGFNYSYDSVSWKLTVSNAPGEIGYTKWYVDGIMIESVGELLHRLDSQVIRYDLEIDHYNPEMGVTLPENFTDDLLGFHRHELAHEFDKYKTLVQNNKSRIEIEMCFCSRVYDNSCAVVSSHFVKKKTKTREECMTAPRKRFSAEKHTKLVRKPSGGYDYLYSMKPF